MRIFHAKFALLGIFSGLLAEIIFILLPIIAFIFHATSTDQDFAQLDHTGMILTKAGNALGLYPSAFCLSVFFPHSSFAINDWLSRVAICFVPQVVFWGMVSYLLCMGFYKLLNPKKQEA